MSKVEGSRLPRVWFTRLPICLGQTAPHLLLNSHEAKFLHLVNASDVTITFKLQVIHELYETVVFPL